MSNTVTISDHHDHVIDMLYLLEMVIT